MAGVRVTTNRAFVMEESSNTETLRLTAIRLAVISSVTNANPDFPAGKQSVKIISST